MDEGLQQAINRARKAAEGKNGRDRTLPEKMLVLADRRDLIGRRAFYMPAEEQAVRHAIEDGTPLAEIAIIHDFKATFEATYRPDMSPLPDEDYATPPAWAFEEAERGPVADDEPPADPGVNHIGKFHRDPQKTELASAVAIYPKTGTQRRQVLDFIAASGVHGATDEEMIESIPLGPSSLRPRRGSLVEGAWIEDSGRTRVLRSGQTGIVWVLTEKGREHYPRLHEVPAPDDDEPVEVHPDQVVLFG